jgi:hypothetical protein
MATVDDALDIAAADTAATGRLHVVEQNQLTMTTKLAGIAQQLQMLLNAGGGANEGGAGGGGCIIQRRRIDPSCLDKLHGDASLSQLRTWKNRWGDFCQLNHLITYPVSEQMAAFRMVFNPESIPDSTADCRP